MEIGPSTAAAAEKAPVNGTIMNSRSIVRWIQREADARACVRCIMVKQPFLVSSIGCPDSMAVGRVERLTKHRHTGQGR